MDVYSKFKVSINNDLKIKSLKEIKNEFKVINKVIFVNNNLLTRFEHIENIKYTKILYATGNKIKTFNQKFLGTVEMINLSNNNLKRIPKSITKSSIKRLILNFNNIKKINIKESEIEELHVTDDGLRKISANVRELVCKSNKIIKL